MANNALIQSGQRLHTEQGQQANIGDAFREGQQLITDQIDKNLKFERDAEDREYLTKRRQDEEQLRGINLEKSITQYQEEKGAYFSVIEEGLATGRLNPIDYAGFTENREAWWKDKANQLKFFEDSPELKKSLAAAEKAEANWPKLMEFTGSVSISDSSPEAQKMDLAISAWSKNNGATPPPIKTIDGKDYFVIPSADGKEEVKIPVDQAGTATQPSDIYGQYNEKVTFEGFQADLMKAYPGVDKRFRQGLATKDDLAQMNQWFDKQVQNNEQLIELADSFIQSLPDADFEAMGISDINDDGKITGADLDLNGDGTIDGEELKGMRGLFGEVVSGFYGQEQAYQKEGTGQFTEAQVNTYNAFDGIKKSGGSLNSLLSLPGVFDIQIQADKGQGIIFLGDSRKEANAFIVPVDAQGRITQEGYAKLAAKFKLTDINPNNSGDNITEDGNGNVTVTQGTPENTLSTTVLGEGQVVQGGPTAEGTVNQIQSEITPTIAITNANFGNEPIKGLPKRFDYNKVINALVGTQISADNLDEIKETLSVVPMKSHERTIVLKYIEGLVRNK